MVLEGPIAYPSPSILPPPILPSYARKILSSDSSFVHLLFLLIPLLQSHFRPPVFRSSRVNLYCDAVLRICFDGTGHARQASVSKRKDDHGVSD